MAVARDGVPADVIEHERKIATAQAAESGKPANIVEKMVEGGVAKFLADVTLLGQPFVKGDGKQTVGDCLKAQGATVQRLRALRRRRRHREEEGRFRGRGRGDGQGVKTSDGKRGSTASAARAGRPFL